MRVNKRLAKVKQQPRQRANKKLAKRLLNNQPLRQQKRSQLAKRAPRALKLLQQLNKIQPVLTKPKVLVKDPSQKRIPKVKLLRTQATTKVPKVYQPLNQLRIQRSKVAR